MQILKDRRVSAIQAIFKDIDMKKIKGFHIQHVAEFNANITCWVDTDKIYVTDEYTKVISKKEKLTSYIPNDKIVKVEIID